jgi:phosphohistidine phosphatase SixA
MRRTGDERFLILIRHASRDFGAGGQEHEQPMLGWTEADWLRTMNLSRPDAKTPGLPRTRHLAGRLADELLLAGWAARTSIPVQGIWHSGHEVARQTASVVHAALAERGLAEPGSVPSARYSYLDPVDGSPDDCAKAVRQWAERSPANTALVLVGHQPSLTLIAGQLCGRALPARVLPLDNSELACFRLRLSRWPRVKVRLLWALTAKSREVGVELRDKIARKYEVAKITVGALVVNSGLFLAQPLWTLETSVSQAIALTAVLFLLAGLGLAIGTLGAYDRLMMPVAFWAEARAPRGREPARPPKWSVLRPPGQYHLVLFYEMVHVWKVFFVPALVMTLVAIVLIVVALSCDWGVMCETASAWPGEGTLIILTILSPVVLLATWRYYLRKRPELGVPD